jgi:hypothetical protein
MTWGQNPQKSEYKKREVPYLPYSNSNIKRFAPLPNKDYTATIVTKNGWAEPVEMWVHTVTKNGNFFGTFFSRNTSMGEKVCPFAYANQMQLQKNGGIPIENKQRVYPLGKRYVFPLVIDEVPNEAFLFYMMSERELNKLVKVFQMAGKSPSEVKVKISRTGAGAQDTSYMYTVTDEPVNAQMIEKLDIQAINKENYKEYLINLENPYNQDLGLNLIDPTQIDNQSQPTNISNSPFTAQQPNAPQIDESGRSLDAAIEQQNIKSAAADYVIEFGPFAGKKLGEMDKDTLQIIADSMDGDIQEKAVQLLSNK